MMPRRINTMRLAARSRILYRWNPAVPSENPRRQPDGRKAVRLWARCRSGPVRNRKRPRTGDQSRAGCLRGRWFYGRLGRKSLRFRTPTRGSGLFLGCFFPSRLFSRLFFGRLPGNRLAGGLATGPTWGRFPCHLLLACGRFPRHFLLAGPRSCCLPLARCLFPGFSHTSLLTDINPFNAVPLPPC